LIEAANRIKVFAGPVGQATRLGRRAIATLRASHEQSTTNRVAIQTCVIGQTAGLVGGTGALTGRSTLIGAANRIEVFACSIGEAASLGYRAITNFRASHEQSATDRVTVKTSIVWETTGLIG